jgi:hypothetical protein
MNLKKIGKETGFMDFDLGLLVECVFVHTRTRTWHARARSLCLSRSPPL